MLLRESTRFVFSSLRARRKKQNLLRRSKRSDEMGEMHQDQVGSSEYRSCQRVKAFCKPSAFVAVNATWSREVDEARCESLSRLCFGKGSGGELLSCPFLFFPSWIFFFFLLVLLRLLLRCERGCADSRTEQNQAQATPSQSSARLATVLLGGTPVKYRGTLVRSRQWAAEVLGGGSTRG
jgi:hypothetical protein